MSGIATHGEEGEERRGRGLLCLSPTEAGRLRSSPSPGTLLNHPPHHAPPAKGWGKGGRGGGLYRLDVALPTEGGGARVVLGVEGHRVALVGERCGAKGSGEAESQKRFGVGLLVGDEFGSSLYLARPVPSVGRHKWEVAEYKTTHATAPTNAALSGSGIGRGEP